MPEQVTITVEIPGRLWDKQVWPDGTLEVDPSSPVGKALREYQEAIGRVTDVFVDALTEGRGDVGHAVSCSRAPDESA